MRRATLTIALACALFSATSAVAQAETVTADLGIVSVTASVTHVHVGDPITLTAVAEDFGPDPISSSLDVSYRETAALPLRTETCIGGANPSPDTPSCEFGPVGVGEAVTTRVRTRVVATGQKYLEATFCVSQEAADFVDPNPANDCGSVTVKVVGNR